VPRISLQARAIEDVVQGPMLERHRKRIEGKSEEQLIQIAGPTMLSYEIRLLAANRLETTVSTSKNRISFYLLAMNDIPNSAAKLYRGSIYETIYRAEIARSLGR
jgi:hypothetical protein